MVKGGPGWAKDDEQTEKGNASTKIGIRTTGPEVKMRRYLI